MDQSPPSIKTPEPVRHYIKEGILYEPVIPQISDWPIARLFTDKDRFVNAVAEDAINQLVRMAGNQGEGLQDLIARTMYLERIRISEDPWKVDPNDERRFWGGIKRGLVSSEQTADEAAGAFEARNMELLSRIVNRYSQEIASTFKGSTYHFAKRFLPFFFSTLLNASAGKTLKSVIYHNVSLQERVHLEGEVQAIRNLATKGTIVLVPTHLSNVDSILVGWGLHALGLPAFIYGAGLNLYNNKVLAYFMNRLGAYTVDRRKKNPIYLQTLNSYSNQAIIRGVHSLFFPGGTRSRSGTIEKKLKLGLLGTAMEAQRRHFVPGATPLYGRKIFVVPMVMSYHFVLEAATLIRQHLQYTGREQYYIIDDEFASYVKILKFVWRTFSSSSDIVLALGKPMDLFGNFVDDNGVSYDSQGRVVDIRDYFMTRGEIREDPQRDAEYTRMLGQKIVERYHIENRVFSSHLVAFVAFEMLSRSYPKLDLFELLRITEDERVISLERFSQTLERVLNRLRELETNGKVHLAQHLKNDVGNIIEHGIKNIGLYHAKRPLTFLNEHQVTSENMNLLYYYHNRLEGYELESYIE